MAASDKIRILSSVPTKVYLNKKRVTKIYRADTKTQIFPFAPPLPIIDSIDPSSGLIAGGSTVIITGEFFSTASAVKFGTTNASGFTINSSTTITATVPPGPLGNTTITVTNVTGVSNAYPFTYTDRAPAQRMYKLGAFTLPGNLSYQNVIGFAADPSYAATTVIDDRGLVVKGGAPILIEAAQLRNGTNGGNRLRIIDTEGVEVAVKTSASPIVIAPFIYTPPIDTILRTQGYAGSGLGGNPTIPDDPATYLMVTPQ